jgi:hypothetical protein
VNKKEGIPMPFDDSDEGWGICTLRSKERYGSTSFHRYKFDLPKADYFLPLELGGTISLSCLDGDGNVAQAEFFPFQPKRKSKLGTFSILVPDPDSVPSSTIRTIKSDGSALVGSFNSLNDAEQANLARVIKDEIEVGDEIALQPGSSRLEYKGRHLPVTNIVYIAAGTGIAPVLDQVRAVVPDSAASTVESANVVWINNAANDFDLIAEILEREYYKYSRKLAVTCVVVDDLHHQGHRLSDVADIDEAVDMFKPGTMAVLAGPSACVKKAVTFLQEDRGFPRDCICIL